MLMNDEQQPLFQKRPIGAAHPHPLHKFFTKTLMNQNARKFATAFFYSFVGILVLYTLFGSAAAWQPVLNKGNQEQDPILQLRIKQAENDKVEIDANKKKAEAEAAAKAATDANKSADEQIAKIKAGEPIEQDGGKE